MESWPRGVDLSNGNGAVAPLPVVSIQTTSPDAWLRVVQRAVQESSGVLAIADLRKEMDWREACILSDMLLKCYMGATQHHPLELHRGVDLERGQGWSSSQLGFQTLKLFQPHVDRGVFNVVLGLRSAFRALFVQGASDPWPFGATPCVYDRTSGADDSLLAVVIPGYSLHLFEPLLPAPSHWVLHAGDSDRQTQVFRCRLRPDFAVAGMQIGVSLQQATEQGQGFD